MSKGKSKRATILDIAREADVSPATVSRVLSDSGYPVKEELCARVRKAAQKLNYKPNIFSQMQQRDRHHRAGPAQPVLCAACFRRGAEMCLERLRPHCVQLV